MKTDFIDANRKWLGERVIANLEQVPDACWLAIVAATEEKGGREPGIDCDVVITHETLADFDESRQRHWRERGDRHEHTFHGCAALAFDGFQAMKGQARRSIIVIDCGDRRVVLE